jgi:hypothetical protein
MLPVKTAGIVHSDISVLKCSRRNRIDLVFGIVAGADFHGLKSRFGH